MVHKKRYTDTLLNCITEMNPDKTKKELEDLLDDQVACICKQFDIKEKNVMLSVNQKTKTIKVDIKI